LAIFGAYQHLKSAKIPRVHFDIKGIYRSKFNQWLVAKAETEDVVTGLARPHPSGARPNL
jgi:hypothetical protein